MQVFEKKIFLFVCLIGLLLHGGGIFFFQNMPFRGTNHTFSKNGCDNFLHQDTAQEWVIDCVDWKQKTPEIKEQLTELKPEFAPDFSLLPLNGEPLSLKESESLGTKTSPAFQKLDLPLSTVSDIEISNGFLEEEAERSFGTDSPSPLLPDPDFSMKTETVGQIAESDHFTVTVSHAPRRFFPGYIFKITLVPKQEIAFKKIRENYFFLIDRSNSIIRGRYYYNKKAVADVLSILHPQDTFNILLFDEKVARFAAKPVPCTEENIKRAHSFLENEGHGGHFAATDIYTSLGKIIPQNVLDTEVNTAILLSDGDTYLPLEKQRELIGGWSRNNRGKISLFCLASGLGNNLALLKVLAKFNKGMLLYSPKHEQIGEKLKDLVLSIRHPIGKHLVATSIALERDVSIYLQPKNRRLPDLYKNQGFTIYGSTNRLADFTLFLQGKYYERRFDIKKKIVFSESLGGSVTLEREWAELVAEEYYDKFFQDGKTVHLESAKQLLAPLNIEVPFL